ncbi:hypothetical protein GH714_030761 [Hevea brasiliensis]|uniref:Uncharacterized protein n=1 Tax=Hevea brasiliensis TaxID=3981 RepID=A0A6A6LSG8_HEVBR|nr:hypothetical protein GH714_030761 [Hevea brasiliensis]
MRQSSSSINNHNPVQLWDLLVEDGLPSNGMSNVMDQSSVSAQTPVRSQDLLAELSSSAVASAGIVQSLEERHSRSLITPFQLSVNMSPGNGQLTNSGSCIDQNPFANDHSNSSSLVISSGIAKYIVKENDGGEGCSLDGRHLYCKRKTPKDEQLCARLVFALEAAPVMHQPSSVAASVLGAGARPSDIHQTIGVAGESQQSRRNIRLRRAPEDEQLGLFFKPNGSCIDQNPFANDPSNSSSLIISSGIAEYIVEENDGGEGCSLNEAAPFMHQPSSVAASGLRAGVELSDIHQTIGVAGEAQHSQRNIHMRRASEDEQLGLLFIPSGSCINQNLFANDPSNSNSLVISSRIAEYIVEENDSGEGCSLDGMRLYCKKRAPQDEQLGTRCVLTLEAAPIMHSLQVL